MIFTYVNFSGGNSFITLEIALWALVAGLFCGFAASLYSKVYLGRVVRRLSEKDAIGKDSAVPFSELGIKPSRLLKKALRDTATLRKHVFVANPEESAIADKSSDFTKKMRKFFRGKAEADTSYDLSRVILFIPVDKKYSAEVKYENRGNPALLIPVALVLFAIVAVLLYFGMPKILEMLDSLITSFKNI